MQFKTLAHASAWLSVISVITSIQAVAKDDTSFTIGDIIVTAKPLADSSANVITSVDRLGGDVAQGANINYIWELVGRLPGVLVTNFNQGATSGKFSFRGFNGEGEINAVKLLIDGIPSNSNDGNMPYIDAVFPIDIAQVDVIRGTSDPRYGLHNIAGNANILTRIGGSYADAKASLGRHSNYEGQLSAGYESGHLSQNHLIACRKSGGYRDHADFDRMSFAGKWFYALTDDIKIGAIARNYSSDAQEPGYLTLAESRTNPRMSNSYNASDGDMRRVRQYSVHLNATLAETIGWSTKAYINQLRDDRYVKFSAAAAQQRRVTNENHWGVMTTVNYSARIGSIAAALEAGGNIEKQDNVSQRYLTVAQVPSSQARNQQYNLIVGGVYIQAIVQPADWITITPAYRVDWVGGDFTNLLNNSSAPINDYGSISQPKIAVALTLAKGVTVYGNWGRSFQIGVGSGAYLIAPRRLNLAPSNNEGFEVGLKYAVADSLEARLAVWQQTATGEIKRKLNDPLGDFDNLGATQRRGVDAQLSVRPVPGLSLWGAIAWQKAIITAPDPATPALRGNEIDHVPNWLVSGGLDVTLIDKVRLSLWGGGQSAYELTPTNNRGRFGDFITLNAEAAYRLTPQVGLSVSAKNLTNSYYEYVWWDGTQTLHSPASGLDVTASIRLRF
jgi:iron complex outermembrane recepter protein